MGLGLEVQTARGPLFPKTSHTVVISLLRSTPALPPLSVLPLLTDVLILSLCAIGS